MYSLIVNDFIYKPYYKFCDRNENINFCVTVHNTLLLTFIDDDRPMAGIPW